MQLSTVHFRLVALTTLRGLLKGNLMIQTCVSTSYVGFYKLFDHKKFNKPKHIFIMFEAFSILDHFYHWTDL